MTVLDVDALRDRAASVGELLDRVPGVRVRRLGPLGAFRTLSIRGADPEQVIVLLDGVRIDPLYGGAVDLESLPLASIERIEVVRGPVAARYGADPVGGALRIVTRRVEPRALEIEGTAASFGTWGASAHAGAAGHAGAVTAGAERLRSRNDFRFERRADEVAGGAAFAVPDERFRRVNADFLRHAGLVRFERELGGGRRLAVVAAAQGLARGQPGSVLATPVGVPDERVSCPTARERHARAVGIAEVAGPAGPGSFVARAGVRSERGRLEDPGGRCGFVVPAARGGRDEVGHVEREITFELEGAVPRRTFGPLAVGARAASTLRLGSVRASEADRARRREASLFGQLEVALLEGRLRIVPALGLDLARTEPVRVRLPGLGATARVRPPGGAAWLPRFGVVLAPAPGLRLQATIERAVRRPNALELFLPDQGVVRGEPRLRPEEAWSAEAGVRLARSRLGPLRDVRVEAVAFRTEAERLIEWVRINQATVAPRNVGASRIRGWELAAAARFGRLEADVAFTRLRSELRATGRPLPHRPERRLAAGATLPLGPFELRARALRESGFALEPSGALRARGSGQLDLGLALDLGRVARALRGARLALEVVNATDAHRVDSLGLPVPGRTVFARLLWSRAP